MSKYYLYGAAVQGIQQFIFKTNELKDIITASDKIKAICTEKFEELLNDCALKLDDSDNAVINAAGNIKYIFKDPKACEYVVRNFPRKVLEFAPGITISQAVVAYEDSNKDWLDIINRLEARLHTQRNRPMPSQTLGLMGIFRTGGTNLPVMEIVEQGSVKQSGKMSLCEDAFGLNENGHPWETTFDTDEMNEKNSWIAVIHADGNGLGRVVQNIGGDREKFRRFSQQLDKDTKMAAQRAFASIREDYKEENWKKVPIRPIVLGGDDFSVICRADLALDYVKYFIKEFEDLSKKNVKGGLTACAGISYIKSSFPFYYAYELAESLCAAAKKDTKERYGEDAAPSCVMFHKVQDSFVTSYADIELRELHPNKDISFKFGPYYLDDKTGRWTIDALLSKVSVIEASGKEGNAIKSRLRNWMTLLHDNPAMAKQDLDRIKAICKDKDLLKLINEVTTPVNGRIPAYDILALHTLKNQVTK